MPEKTAASKFLLFLMPAIFLAVAACAPNTENLVPVSPQAQVKKPAYPVQAGEYRIRPGDTLDIKFLYNKDLNEKVTVRPDGRISLQMVQEVVAAGLTPAALTEQLTKDYASKLAKPEITIIVSSFGGQMVFVDGEVNKPGMLNMIAPMTVLQSISEAGGLKDTANTGQVIIIRRGFGNKPVALSLNVEKIIYGGARDFWLLPDDIVYIPRSRIADVNLWVDQYIRKNIPINADAGIFYNFNPKEH